VNARSFATESPTGPAAGASLAVKEYADGDAGRWSAFVERCPEATFFHRPEWHEIIASVFGHRTHYLYAERAGEIVGVLPLAHVASRLFGSSLVSLPFCVYGGAAVTEPAARAALHRRASELASALRVGHLELRNREPTEPDWQTRDLYATFRKSLLPDPEANFDAIPSKRRNMVRRAAKAGLRAVIGDSIERFFPLYADNVHRHGTPPFPKRYFAALAQALGDDHEILTVVDASGQPVASAFLFYFRGEVIPYYVGDCPAARELAANDFMYWQIIRHAAARGCRTFDWSRSKKGTGSFEFKRTWGFEPQPLHYEYLLVEGKRVPENNPLNPKYRLLIRLWRQLPLPVANLIGPHIVKSLG
jgi:FemAB-related protein (PEP-CTERM system-associated)